MRVRSSNPTEREAVQALSHHLTEGVAPWRDPFKVGAAVAGWIRESLDRAATETCAVFVASEADQAVAFVIVAEQRHWSSETDARVGELVVAVHARGASR